LPAAPDNKRRSGRGCWVRTLTTCATEVKITNNPSGAIAGGAKTAPDATDVRAFIGNCCANDDGLGEAEKERKWRERWDDRRVIYCPLLPLVAPKLAILEVA
jgi:hypothetical protein